MKQESPEINQCVYMINRFTTEEPRIYNRVGTVSSINAAMKTTVTCKGMKLDHHLIPYTRINSKWIQDFNRRLKTTNS